MVVLPDYDYRSGVVVKDVLFVEMFFTSENKHEHEKTPFEDVSHRKT